MKKKIIGIFICLLFLFSTLPVVASADVDENNEEPLMKTDDNEFQINEFYFYFVIYYGKIVYNGEEYVDFPYYEICYNITPITLRGLGIVKTYYYGFFPIFGKVPFDPWFIPKSEFHGFIGKNYIFGIAYNISIILIS